MTIVFLLREEGVLIAKVVLMTQLRIKPLQEGIRSCSRRPPLFVVPIERHYREFSTKVLWSKNANSRKENGSSSESPRTLLQQTFESQVLLTRALMILQKRLGLISPQSDCGTFSIDDAMYVLVPSYDSFSKAIICLAALHEASGLASFHLPSSSGVDPSVDNQR